MKTLKLPIIGDIAATALALGVISVDQEFQVSKALWLGQYHPEELVILSCLIDALEAGWISRYQVSSVASVPA